jgi:hypothetical protein
MPQIYYKEEKIQGVPIETPVINLKNFDFLMTCPRPNIPIEFPLKFLDCFKLIRKFRFTDITNAGFAYNTSEGNYYIPKTIIFYDVYDCAFPTLFYFIAKIDKQLEIRLVRGGKAVEWFQIPDLQEPVTDNTIIKRIELTLENVLAYLENYKEPDKPKATKIQGVTLDLKLMEQFLIQLNEQDCHAKKIVEMAESPSDYFDSNEKQLLEYQIFDASQNMYLLYLVSLLEENKRMVTVDWKAEYSDVLYVLNELSSIEFENIDEHKYSRSTAGKILSALNQQVEFKTNKTIFCIDTDSDSYSFGLIEKNKLKELKKTGKELNIKVYQPKKQKE